MNIITQNAYHRQRMLNYLSNHGATKEALRYKVSRKTIYKWNNRYDGTLESLKDRSHKPLTSPKSHSDAEIAMIKKVMKKAGAYIPARVITNLLQ